MEHVLDEEAVWAQLITASKDVVEANWMHFSALDQAIGDGDHGANLQRGFNALYDKQAEFITLPFNEACKKAGMTLIMNIGGASGPLLGSLIVAFGSEHVAMPRSQEQLAKMFRAGVDAVKFRGKSDTGAKTMVDVLEPVALLLEGQLPVTAAQIIGKAKDSANATIELVGTKGRAAFLGERSRGHMDPGAYSVSLIIEAICNSLKEKS